MELKTKKDEAFWKILNAAIELDYKKGHLKWTMTELSRRSGVTRSLIYYYFGRQKAAILKEAVKIVGEEFVGLNERRTTAMCGGGVALSVKEVIGRPIVFASTGEKLDAFEQFHPDRMAGRILGMGYATLIEQAEKVFEADQAEQAAAAFTRRVHTRRLPRADAGTQEDGSAVGCARHDARDAQGDEERQDRR